MMPNHLLTVRELTRDMINGLFAMADDMKGKVVALGGSDTCKHKVAALYFCEPSTRTSASFQAAIQRLGGSSVCVNCTDSSMKKGESFQDTVQTLSSYCDVVIVRHPDKGSAYLASEHSRKPVINAGDGAGEHPTQALLDLYTIQNEFGSIGGLSEQAPMVITVLGDLKNSRTVHSLVLLLALYEDVRLLLVAPAGLEMPAELLGELTGRLAVQSATLEQAVECTDVLYVTRIQRERFASEEEYAAVLGSYCVDAALMVKAKPKMIVMHPLPRLGEIAPEVDEDPRAAYFRQMENGMYVRMAILQQMLLR